MGLTDACVQQNVAPDPPEFAIPTLLIAPRDAAPLHDAAASGKEGYVCLDAEFAPLTGHNVIATLEGDASNTLVVLTSLSGWYTCAAERAPGIVGALAILDRYSALSPEARPGRLVVVITSGHELHHAGADGAPRIKCIQMEFTAELLQLGASICSTEWNHCQAYVLGCRRPNRPAPRDHCRIRNRPSCLPNQMRNPMVKDVILMPVAGPSSRLAALINTSTRRTIYPSVVLNEGPCCRKQRKLPWKLAQQLHDPAWSTGPTTN